MIYLVIHLCNKVILVSFILNTDVLMCFITVCIIVLYWNLKCV